MNKILTVALLACSMWFVHVQAKLPDIGKRESRHDVLTGTYKFASVSEVRTSQGPVIRHRFELPAPLTSYSVWMTTNKTWHCVSNTPPICGVLTLQTQNPIKKFKLRIE